MNGNPFKPVASGDRWAPKKDWLNEVTRATQAYRQNRSNMGADPRTVNIKEGLILVKNNSGANIKTGEALSIDGAVFGPDDNLNEFLFNFAVAGETITDADKGKFVIAKGPIADGDIGPAYIFGVCPARVKVSSSSDDWAEVVSGQKYLQSGASGSAQILDMAGSNDPDGNRWALVRLTVSAGCSSASTKNLTSGATTWDRTTDATGATFLMATGVKWDTSTGVLSYLGRTITIDACGKIVSIGAEGTVTVDTAGPCT